MYHTIKFRVGFKGDHEISPKHRLERVILRKGTRLRTQLKPYVVETDDGPIEVADLFLDDGTTMRGVPFGAFAFVE